MYQAIQPRFKYTPIINDEDEDDLRREFVSKFNIGKVTYFTS